MDVDAMLAQRRREELTCTTRIRQRVRVPDKRNVNAARICTSAQFFRWAPGIRAAGDRQNNCG
jgi:hypothetical protein